MPRFNLACTLMFALVSIVLASAQQFPAKPVNLDFKQDKSGQEPTGWLVPPVTKESYHVKVVANTPAQGQNSVVMTFVGKSADTSGQNGFGNLMQEFGAENYRGKRVRFRAKVKYESGAVAGQAMLWMRVDRPNGAIGFFDNMADRPIVSPVWKNYEIVGEIAKDAEVINIGCMMLGGGKVWLTDASLTAEDSQLRPDEPPKPLTEQGRANIIAFAKLYGYLRFFCPSDEAAQANWNKIAYTGVKAIEDAPDSTELAKRLEAFFRPIAPTVQVYTGIRDIMTEFPLPAGDKKPQVVMWRHTGVGGGTILAERNAYSSKRQYGDVVNGKIPDGFADPTQWENRTLSDKVSALIPISLYVQDGHTLPKSTEKMPELLAPQSGNDRTTRLADVIIAWNIFQHFYPYFDVVKTDWNQALVDALNAAATDKDERAFQDTLRRLVVALHDGHGNVILASNTARALPPFAVGRIEGKLVVTHTVDGAEGLKPGDILLKVDGQDAEAIYQHTESLVSGTTPQWIRHRTLLSFLAGTAESSLVVEAQRGDAAPFRVTVKRSVTVPLVEPRPAPIAEIKPGIWYVDMDSRRAVTKNFVAALPKLETAKGIIFDMRGYPNEMAMEVLPHLTDTPITSANWNIPLITQPDREHWQWQTSRWEAMPPAKPRLKAKIAFLTYGGAISYAESIMGIVENYKLGEIVGETTAGTNGNINPFALPGGYQITWTGMKVTKHDGSQHHGVGIKPTVPVERTIKGVTEKRDEVLERAIEVVTP